MGQVLASKGQEQPSKQDACVKDDSLMVIEALEKLRKEASFTLKQVINIMKSNLKVHATPQLVNVLQSSLARGVTEDRTIEVVDGCRYRLTALADDDEYSELMWSKLNEDIKMGLLKPNDSSIGRTGTAAVESALVKLRIWISFTEKQIYNGVKNKLGEQATSQSKDEFKSALANAISQRHVEVVKMMHGCRYRLTDPGYSDSEFSDTLSDSDYSDWSDSSQHVSNQLVQSGAGEPDKPDSP